MGWLDPFDYNQNGKVDDDDWFLEEEDRKFTEELWKKYQEDKKYSSPEPPSEAGNRQGFRALVTLIVSGFVCFFFYNLKMYVIATIATLAVMLIMLFAFVKPWPETNVEESPKPTLSPETIKRQKREKAILFSVLGAIILIPSVILLTVYLLPPIASASIGTDFSSWEKHYKNAIITTKVDGENHRFQCSAFNQKVFGIEATATYYFNSSDKLEYIRITSSGNEKKYRDEDIFRILERVKLRYRSPRYSGHGCYLWQSGNYEVLELYYGIHMFIIQPRGYFYNENSFEKVFQLKEYEFRWRSEEYYAQQRAENAIRANAERESRRQKYAAQKEAAEETSFYRYGSSQYGSVDDPYDVQSYDNPDDFFYDHPDDFYDYEDAEAYWEERSSKSKPLLSGTGV